MEPEEELGHVLEVAEGGDVVDVQGQGPGVVGVEPECGGVEALFIGLAGAADGAEVADELEGGEGVVVPGGLELLVEGLGRGVGEDVVEEVEARVACGYERGGVVLRVAPRRRPQGAQGGVELGRHDVHEWIAGSGGGGGGGGRGVDFRRAKEWSHGCKIEDEVTMFELLLSPCLQPFIITTTTISISWASRLLFPEDPFSINVKKYLKIRRRWVGLGAGRRGIKPTFINKNN